MAKYRVLCLDGGGIRGIYTAQLLIRLQKEVPDLLDDIDLYAGTSTGGLFSLLLAAGKTPYDAKKLYENDGDKIFYRSFWRKLRTIWGLIGAKYDNKNLEACVKAEFGQKTFGDLAGAGKHVVITSFKLDGHLDGHRTWRPVLMDNFETHVSVDNKGLTLVSAAMRTSAAPTYFPSYQGYVDGGVAANNPSMVALAQALHNDKGKQTLDDVCLFSVGTGLVEHYQTGERNDWGLWQWVRPLVNILSDGSMELVDEQCHRLLKHSQYHRLAPALPKPIALDGYKEIPDLIRYANEVDISDTVTWLKDNFVDG